MKLKKKQNENSLVTVSCTLQTKGQSRSDLSVFMKQLWELCVYE